MATGTAKHTALLLAAITLVGFVLRIICAAVHPPTVDDLMVAISSINFVESGQLGPTMWNHPDLRNLFAYGMLKLFGSGLVGVLGVNLLMGTLCTLLIYAVAEQLTCDRRSALIAALLWAFEPLAIEYSSQAINDVYLAFFPLLGIFAACRYLDGRRTAWLLTAGAAFGLGLASKWSALFQLGVIGVLVLFRLFRDPPTGLSARLARLLVVASALVILPATIYLATFAPWFARGYSLAEWLPLQKSMYEETKHHLGYHEEIYGDHIAAEWFVRPGISHVDRVFTLPADPVAAEPNLLENLQYLIAVANPLVWLAVIPALLALLYRARRERSEGLTVLAALLLASYLPMAVVHRPVWFNTGMVVLPYVVMTVACAIGRFLAGGGAWRLRAAAFYLAVTCLVSFCLYPLAIGMGFRLPVIGGYLLEKAMHEQGVSKEQYEKGNQ